MRERGRARTAGQIGVRWSDGTGEDTGQPDGGFDLVTFGSSFNVTERGQALVETARILRPGGWFACMWNHRDLDEPTQSAIERTIRGHLPGYDYGTRREDQTAVIAQSGLFEDGERIEGPVRHTQSIVDWVDAWRSHATLQRQAGAAFGAIVDEIDALLTASGKTEIVVPYTTRIWLAPLCG
jgi:SAM-dependent methyltransferase